MTMRKHRAASATRVGGVSRGPPGRARAGASAVHMAPASALAPAGAAVTARVAPGANELISHRRPRPVGITRGTRTRARGRRARRCGRVLPLSVRPRGGATPRKATDDKSAAIYAHPMRSAFPSTRKTTGQVGAWARCDNSLLPRAIPQRTDGDRRRQSLWRAAAAHAMSVRGVVDSGTGSSPDHGRHTFAFDVAGFTGIEIVEPRRGMAVGLELCIAIGGGVARRKPGRHAT